MVLEKLALLNDALYHTSNHPARHFFRMKEKYKPEDLLGFTFQTSGKSSLDFSW